MKKNCITFFASIIIILSALLITAFSAGTLGGFGGDHSGGVTAE